MVYRYIVNDIQNVNKKHKSEKINRTLQHQLYTVLEDKTNEVAAKKSLDVMVELYKYDFFQFLLEIFVFIFAIVTTPQSRVILILSYIQTSSVVRQ